MIAAICCLLSISLVIPSLKGAGLAATNPPLTVLMDFESPHSETSFQSLRQGLNRLLSPGGMNVSVALKADLPLNPQFGQLVVFKMKGSCSMSPVRSNKMAEQRGPLALAYTSDGQVLHFGEVECDRIRYTLQRILGRGASMKNQETYGSALAIVMAHEVYHMLGNVVHHTHEGLTKPALSAYELTDPDLSLPPGAVATIRHNMHISNLVSPK